MNDAQNGTSLCSIMVRNRASSCDDRLPMIIEDFFWDNRGQSVCLLNGFSHLVAAGNCPYSGLKLRASWRGLKRYRKWAFLSEIRVRNGASSDADRLPMISPDLDGYHGKSMCLRNDPLFC